MWRGGDAGLKPVHARCALTAANPAPRACAAADKIPMKRCGLLSEISAIVAFAVSKEASFTTGFTFDATGGRAVY